MDPTLKDGRRPKLLSLDHFGTRILPSLFILKKMMERISEERGPETVVEPWQVFDLIGGVGGGGIVAIMLGRLQMSLVECIARFHSFSTSLRQPSPGKPAIVDMDALGKAVKDISLEIDGKTMLMDGSQQSCKVYVSSLLP